MSLNLTSLPHITQFFSPHLTAFAALSSRYRPSFFSDCFLKQVHSITSYEPEIVCKVAPAEGFYRVFMVFVN